MAVLIDETTRVMVQGITGRQGRYHTERMLEYGVRVVAGVSPGHGGETVAGVPVFDTVGEALSQTEVDATLILVPPPGVLHAGLEAVDAKIPLIVIVTEHVPVHDSLCIVHEARLNGVRIVGPNTIGVIAPGRAKVGIMPGQIYSPGHVGVISRSGTLCHEVSSSLTFRGIGQSTCIGIGGDPVIGTSFEDALRLFRDDPETKLVVMIGEIGGRSEEAAADHVMSTAYPKPVFAFVAGSCAPTGKKMGHAGAIVGPGMGGGTAQAKKQYLRQRGVRVADTLEQLLAEVSRALNSV